MRIVHTVAALGALDRAGVTIGNFDGVHLGHQTLIRRTLDISRQEGLTPVVMTFWPHPRQVLFPERGHMPLTSREDRLALLEGLGVPNVLELPFTRELAALEAAVFVREILLPMRLRRLIVGYDFSLGRNRGGQAPVLQEIGSLHGFSVEQLAPVMAGDAVVSSTALRSLIGRGNVAHAACLLGRYHGFSGEVVHGDGRGAGIGFPTANQRTPAVVLPAEGVYATRAHVRNRLRPSVTVVGRKPTFGENELGVETFLLEGGENLYGRVMRLEFVDRIRSEQQFSSVEELKRRIALDVEEARGILARAPALPSPASTEELRNALEWQTPGKDFLKNPYGEDYDPRRPA